MIKPQTGKRVQQPGIADCPADGEQNSRLNAQRKPEFFPPSHGFRAGGITVTVTTEVGRKSTPMLLQNGISCANLDSMKSAFSGYASFKKGEPLRPFEFDPGELGADQVEIVAEYCGICHSDVSMLENDWGMTKYPIVPRHEVVGKVVAVGSQAKNLRVGQRVGIGWLSGVPLPRGCPAPTGLRPAARVN